MSAQDVEHKISIPETDLTIYGTLREVPGAPLVVFSHCLTGNRNSLEYFTSARAFSEQGISSYRFDYYAYEDNARNMVDCTINDHVSDLDLVVNTFKAEQPERSITVIGHSLGGLVVMMSKAQEFDAAVLWDATHNSAWKDPTHLEDGHTVWEPALNMFRFRWGIDILVTREYLESYRMLDHDDIARKFNKPLLVVTAGEGVLQEGGRRYHEHSAGTSELIVLDGADHCFYNGETLRELQQLTVEWVKGQVSAYTQKRSSRDSA